MDYFRRVWDFGDVVADWITLQTARHPIPLNKGDHLTLLIVRECHERVVHGGIKTTLKELRSKYWIVHGRNFIKTVLCKCVVCRRSQGKQYSPPPAPPLPSFRVKEAKPTLELILPALCMYETQSLLLQGRYGFVCIPAV